MDMVGLQICLDSCSNCGKNFDESKNYKFSIATGGILCDNCYENLTIIKGKIVSIHPKIVQFLSVLENTNFCEKTRYDELATEKICVSCFELLKDYIAYHSSKKFKSIEIIEFA